MEILQEFQANGTLTPEIAARVEERVNKFNEPLDQALITEGVPEDTVRTAMSTYYGVPVYTYDPDRPLSQNTLAFIPEDSARHYHIVPLAVEDDVLVVGTNEPDNLQTRDVLNFISSKHGKPYKLVFMLQGDLEQALTSYDNLTGEVDEALSTLEDEVDLKVDPETRKQEAKAALEHLKEDAPVTKIVATILRYAVDGGASDIHVEPTETRVRVRFRVDGLLGTSLELPNKVQSAVVARVKILSQMRLDEKRKPQDGRFSASFDGRKIDFRVSVLPTNHGEKVVMRILDNVKGVRTLEDTGIAPYHLQAIRRMVKEPYGIILISGPTGSGKSTSLYAMLSEVDRVTKNVISLEDPVEYNIDGVSQSQIRPEIGYSFATGLRSVLRQDPDVILVGEIRDGETAQLAIQAALTGHLVLSTIHTNNSIGVVPRLVDMGVDPYLIAPTLKLAIAQRLARRICPDTGEEFSIEGGVDAMIEEEFRSLPQQYHDRLPKSTSMLHPEPSPGCTSGTKGRIAVMETLEITDEIESAILRGGSEEEIFNMARKNGFMSMKEDAIIKALEHKIPFEEIGSFGTKVGAENVLHEEHRPLESDIDEMQQPPTSPTTGATTQDPIPEPESTPKPQPVDNLEL